VIENIDPKVCRIKDIVREGGNERHVYVIQKIIIIEIYLFYHY